MEFINYLLGGVFDLIMFIMIIIFMPIIRIINSEKLNTLIEQILSEIFKGDLV